MSLGLPGIARAAIGRVVPPFVPAVDTVARDDPQTSLVLQYGGAFGMMSGIPYCRLTHLNQEADKDVRVTSGTNTTRGA
jgi:hypothetical protein